MNFSLEAVTACVAGAGLFALALSVSAAVHPSYSGLHAGLLAQDLLEVVEKDAGLLSDAYGLANGDAVAASRLSVFLEAVRAAVGGQCLSLSANSFTASSTCSPSGKKIILRRVLFDGQKFFFLEARVSY